MLTNSPSSTDLLATVLGAVIANFVNALFLCGVGKFIFKERITYWNAYVSLLVGYVFSVLVQFVCAKWIPAVATRWMPGGIFILFGGWLIQGGILSDRETALSYGKALLILVVTGVIEVIVLGLLFVLIYGFYMLAHPR